MAYAGRWTKLWPSGAWQVRDERLSTLGAPAGDTMTYFCYDTMREIHMAHAQYVRELKDAHAWRFEN